MPKEVVHTSEQYSSDYPDETLLAQVGWGRDAEYVQLSTVRVKTVTHEPVESTVSGGWYVSLNRSGINDLIRNLRRARDQAFGRDE